MGIKKQVLDALAENLDEAIDEAAIFLGSVLEDSTSLRIVNAAHRFGAALSLSVNTKPGEKRG